MIRDLIANVVFCASVVAAEAKYDGPRKYGGVYVIAHRGAHRGIPKNTLSAHERAIQLGADFVEIGLQTMGGRRIRSRCWPATRTQALT